MARKTDNFDLEKDEFSERILISISLNSQKARKPDLDNGLSEAVKINGMVQRKPH